MKASLSAQWECRDRIKRARQHPSIPEGACLLGQREQWLLEKSGTLEEVMQYALEEEQIASARLARVELIERACSRRCYSPETQSDIQRLFDISERFSPLDCFVGRGVFAHSTLETACALVKRTYRELLGALDQQEIESFAVIERASSRRCYSPDRGGREGFLERIRIMCLLAEPRLRPKKIHWRDPTALHLGSNSKRRWVFNDRVGVQLN